MGARLGRYVLLKHLASGGMADVLLARSDGIEGFERHVVVKRIRPELARDQRFIRMFLDEARVAALLHHQHVVQVHDIAEAGGEYFIAMEYVHGEDVRKILSSASKQRSHVPLGYAVAIVSAAAAGLHYAHERVGSDMQPLGLVHRDVSPSNILVGYDGSIKVVDFGIAKASLQRDTRSGSLKGKLSYMSPEQCKGEDVDRRADVYALGVVLFELATTTRMLKGDSEYRVMEQIVHGKLPPPQTRRPDLPRELSAIIMRALATDRAQRFQTADELRVALDRFAANAGLVASTSTIAAYMRQQFGERREPWLELPAHGALDGLPPPLDGSVPSNSWSELAASDVARRSTGSIPRLATPLPLPAEPDIHDEPTAALPITPAPRHRPAPATHPTESRMGWEAKVPPRPRRSPMAKLALLAGAVAAGVALWLVLRDGPAVKPAVAAITVRPPPPVVVAPDAAVPAATPPAMPAITLADPEAPRPVAHASRHAEPPRRAEPVRRVAMTVAPPPETPKPAPEPEHHVAEPAPPPPPAPAPVIAPPPPPQPAVPQVVAPSALDVNRVAGSKNIPPDASTMDAIARAGKAQVQASYKLCIGADGAVTQLALLRSTGFPDYDAKIQNAVRSEWRYRPYLIDGKATPVCTGLRFLYAQKQ